MKVIKQIIFGVDHTDMEDFEDDFLSVRCKLMTEKNGTLTGFDSEIDNHSFSDLGSNNKIHNFDSIEKHYSELAKDTKFDFVLTEEYKKIKQSYTDYYERVNT